MNNQLYSVRLGEVGVYYIEYKNSFMVNIYTHQLFRILEARNMNYYIQAIPNKFIYLNKNQLKRLMETPVIEKNQKNVVVNKEEIYEQETTKNKDKYKHDYEMQFRSHGKNKKRTTDLTIL